MMQLALTLHAWFLRQLHKTFDTIEADQWDIYSSYSSLAESAPERTASIFFARQA